MTRQLEQSMVERPIITEYYQVMILYNLRKSPCESLTFQELKKKFSLTDGNLAAKLRHLEQTSCIVVSKGFIGKKVSTHYELTATGEMRLHDFIIAFQPLFTQKHTEEPTK